MARNLIIFFGLIVLAVTAKGQDTLPRFTLVSKGNDRIIISWTNPYGAKIRQLSIQRSFDSLRNFKSILTLPDPTVLQNGYVDTKAITNHMFYRLYILLDSGKYVFSVTKRPVPDAGFTNTDFPDGTMPAGQTGFIGISRLRDMQKANALNGRFIFIKKKEVLIGAIPEEYFKNFRDSVNLNTKDTVLMVASDTLVIQLFNAREYFRPSRYVFTEKDGNVKIALNDAATRKYAVKFFEEDNTELFEIKQVKESPIIVDKTNFVHAGWFYFELYEDGKLKEKHKVFVPKDF